MRCIICLTPLKKEIENEVKEGAEYKYLYDKYKTLLNYTSAFDAWKMLLYRHGKHSEGIKEVKKVQALERLEGVDINQLVDKMMHLAEDKLTNMESKDLKLSELFAGQKVLIELKKLKMQEDSMSVAMAKLFGPNIIEGEVIHERVTTRPTKLLTK
jgi:hypothetical protein